MSSNTTSPVIVETEHGEVALERRPLPAAGTTVWCVTRPTVTGWQFVGTVVRTSRGYVPCGHGIDVAMSTVPDAAAVLAARVAAADLLDGGRHAPVARVPEEPFGLRGELAALVRGAIEAVAPRTPAVAL